ncbi:DUF3221 domain-containing protein [Paenibacillus sp. BK033]|uniref:DUF3221 domain-containing protein n=1 Tax=unclassified Paenibacillus TaxID=185978 RepID=UPI00104BBC68|nr:DUF3221 domain-containing protein [Paenibacillus sp. BK033]NIK67347.1 phosphopantetheine adenylyltransferase [Paenibacillus sp. BK720]
MRKTFIFIVVVVLMGGSYLYLRFGPLSPQHALKKQLEQIIEVHDQVSIQALSLDKPTMEYLLELPMDTKVESATDFQGGSKQVGYLVSKVGTKPLHVYMTSATNSIYHKLFPKWTLYKITTAPNGTLPSIRDLQKTVVSERNQHGTEKLEADKGDFIVGKTVDSNIPKIYVVHNISEKEARTKSLSDFLTNEDKDDVMIYHVKDIQLYNDLNIGEKVMVKAAGYIMQSQPPQAVAEEIIRLKGGW